MAADRTLRTYRCVWKRRAAIVACVLCGMTACVLLTILDLPWDVKRTMHVDDGATKLIPTTTTDMLIPAKDVVKVEEAFELKAYPPLIEDGGDLIVSWERNNAVVLTNHDYVTLSCGPTTGENDYLQVKKVREFENSVIFLPLYMMRCNYTAIYFNYEKTSGKHRAIAKVETGMKEPMETPKHGHLSFTDDEKAMATMFNSGTSKTPMVKYGKSPYDLRFHATGTSTTYGADDM